MKKIFIYLQILLFVSCSPTRIEKNIVNDFIEEQIKNEKYHKEVIIIDEIISRKKTIDVYENCWNEKIIKPYLSKKVISINQNYKNDDWPIDSLDIVRIKSKFINDPIIYWKEKNFKNVKYKIVKYTMLKDNLYTDTFINKSVIAYQISKPIIYPDNKTALIYIYSFDVGLGTTQMRSCYLLKKVKDKWVRNIRFDEDIYY